MLGLQPSPRRVNYYPPADPPGLPSSGGRKGAFALIGHGPCHARTQDANTQPHHICGRTQVPVRNADWIRSIAVFFLDLTATSATLFKGVPLDFADQRMLRTGNTEQL